MGKAAAKSGTKWMQKAVKRPGALTAKAKRAGKTVQAYAREKQHAKGKLGAQARFALNAQRIAKKNA